MRFICSILVTVVLFGAVQICSAQQQARYSNFFTEQLGPINWQAIADSVAPNVPDYLFNHYEINEEYKQIVIDWIYAHPEEIDKAKMLDFRLHEFISWAINPNNEVRGGNAYGNPPFVYFPVNEHMPVFIETNNPDQDTRFYNHKLQNWYLQNDLAEYQARYGEPPVIIPYPRVYTHPNQFPAVEYNAYQVYYPEFSEDPQVINQYIELHQAQYGEQPNIDTR